MFTEDDSLIQSARKGVVRVLSPPEHQLKATPIDGEQFDFSNFSSDGRYVAMGRRDWIRVLNVRSGQEIARVDSESTIGPVAFVPGGKLLLYYNDYELRELDLNTGTTNVALPKGALSGSLDSFTVSPDAKHLLVGYPMYSAETEKSRLVVVNRGSKIIASRWELPREWLYSAAFSPDSRMVVAGTSVREGKHLGHSVGGAIHFWKTDGTSLLRHPVESAVWTVAFSADGKFLVTGHEDSTILIWNLATLLENVGR